jgi:hypothetical protein
MDGALRAFDGWMNNSSSVTALVVFLVALPLFTLVHELGHAAVGLARTSDAVHVQVGRPPGRWHLALGRLFVSIDVRPFLGDALGYVATAGRLGAPARFAYAIAGPATSALAGVCVLAVGRQSGIGWLMALGELWIAASLLQLVPLRSAQFRSDGWHMLQALRSRGSHESPTHSLGSRASFAMLEARARMRPKQTQLLGCAGTALGLARDDHGPEAQRLWIAAFAGWCWREAQGAAARLDAPARAALATAAEEGVEGLSLTADAAYGLAQSDADFGAEFEAGLGRLLGVADERRDFAFRFGGALREIQRVHG